MKTWKFTPLQNQLLDLTMELQRNSLAAIIEQIARELNIDKDVKISLADALQTREFKLKEKEDEEVPHPCVDPV